ncbi:hypothetical protein POM88_039777 [Heracleum sosnowskyi]|uniref:BED-type domain-containing protein n=1 Tax=Heracleum sosnowskyi TaxID=360622 RepID=A0AAD8M847_9APIA|nr:hypothetical protein POM88_039777 [Heracleum sosnowskyi]
MKLIPRLEFGKQDEDFQMYINITWNLSGTSTRLSPSTSVDYRCRWVLLATLLLKTTNYKVYDRQVLIQFVDRETNNSSVTMEGPSENQIPQEEAPTKQTDELIHVNLEDDVKCNDKQDDGDKGKKGSVVWDYFNKIPGCPVGKEKAKCSLCNVIIGCFSRNGTSAMMNHLKTVCPKSPLRNNLDKLQKTLRFEIISKEDKSRTLKAHAFNQERWNSTYTMLEVAVKYEGAFIRMVIEDNDYETFFKVNELEVVGENLKKRKKKVVEGPPLYDDFELVRDMSTDGFMNQFSLRNWAHHFHPILQML